MSRQPNPSQKFAYYHGGLAELVTSPTPETFAFFQTWFTGKRSLGQAMEMLNLPYQDTELPILEMVDGELVVNADHEQATLYTPTLFSYGTLTSDQAPPPLQLDWSKMFSWTALRGTLRLLLTQARWISSPSATVQFARQLIDQVPESATSLTISESNSFLATAVWPKVIAIGTLAEFFHHLLQKEAGDEAARANQYITQELAKTDWFYCSVADQYDVQIGQLSFEKYLEKYGVRADKDYELTCPRWQEIPELVRKRIAQASAPKAESEKDLQLSHFPEQLQRYIDASLQLQVLRSEVKRKALIHLAHFRQQLLEAKAILATFTETVLSDPKSSATDIHGKGMPISSGKVAGIVMRISHVDQEISRGSIGIFPNASPEFASQYSQCSGMIFCQGGQTSHGAIIAREYKIPALIDQHAQSIENGKKIEIDGSTGEWRIL